MSNKIARLRKELNLVLDHNNNMIELVNYVRDLIMKIDNELAKEETKAETTESTKNTITYVYDIMYITPTGGGCATVDSLEKLDSEDTIRALERFIALDLKVNRVRVINVRLIEERKEH